MGLLEHRRVTTLAESIKSDQCTRWQLKHFTFCLHLPLTTSSNLCHLLCCSATSWTSCARVITACHRVLFWLSLVCSAGVGWRWHICSRQVVLSPGISQSFLSELPQKLFNLLLPVHLHCRADPFFEVEVDVQNWVDPHWSRLWTVKSCKDSDFDELRWNNLTLMNSAVVI